MIQVLLFVGGYFMLLGALALAVRPYRVRLGELGNEILCDSKSDAVQAHVRAILRGAYSIRSAPASLFWSMLLIVLPPARLIAMAQEAAQEHPALMDEDRLTELYELYRASTAAVNPIFGALAYAAQALFRVKTRIYVRRYHADRRRLTALQIKAA